MTISTTNDSQPSIGADINEKKKARKESATGHVGNSSGPSPANPLGSSSAPMEKAGDSPNQPLYVVNLRDPSATRRELKAKDKTQKESVVTRFVAEAMKVKMRSMREDEPGFSDGVSQGSPGRAGISTKPDVRKGALWGDVEEDDDGAYQMVKNPVDDDGAGNQIADKGWYAEKSKKPGGKIDARSKEFRDAVKRAQERAKKRIQKKRTTK